VSDLIVTILAVIGAIVVLFLLTSVGFVLYVRWKVRRMMRQIHDTLNATLSGVDPASGSMQRQVPGFPDPDDNPDLPPEGVARRASARTASEFIDLMRQQQEQVQTYAAVFRAVREQAGLNEQEWKRIEDRVLLITDLATPQQIAEAVIESLPPGVRVDLSIDAISAELSTGPIRQQFEDWNLAQPPGRRFDRIARVSDPLPADAWLAPG
jgi:hypothetical protein